MIAVRILFTEAVIYSEDLDELESQVSADIAEIDYSINQLAADLLSAESLVNRLWQQL